MSKRSLVIVVALLVLHLASRLHALTIQPAFIDEGFHLQRAMRIYEFQDNPAYYSHGKLLLYFWLGLFDTDNTTTILWAGRLAVALFSLVSAAGVYLLGRVWHSQQAGIIALALYALFPYALFYERMAMADPFASAWVVLLVWRSYVLALRPNYVQAVIVGLILGLTILAKMTTAATVLLPLLAILSFRRYPLRRYLLPLLSAWAIAGVILSPLVFFMLTDPTFSPVDPAAVRVGNSYSAWDYLQVVIGNIREFVGMGSLFVVALFGLLLSRRMTRVTLFLLGWLVLLMLPALFLASATSSRYFMPISAVLVLVVALTLVAESRRWLRWSVGSLIVAWLLVWALPFAYHDLTNPRALPFGFRTAAEYTNGAYMPNENIVQAGLSVNQLNSTEPVYAEWGLCQLIFYSIERPINCIPLATPEQTLLEALAIQPSIIFLTQHPNSPYLTHPMLESVVLATFHIATERNPVRIVRLSRRLSG